MWTVQQRFEERWGRRPALDTRPQFAVVDGAARYAADLRLGKRLMRPCRPRYSHTIGFRSSSGTQTDQRNGFKKLIGRNTPLPFKKTFRLVPHYRTQRSVRLTIAIEEETRDRTGIHFEPIDAVRLEQLPGKMEGEDETIVIHVSCGVDGRLTLRIAFRRRCRQVDVDELTRKVTFLDPKIDENGTTEGRPA
jgi:hypothetical protein